MSKYEKFGEKFSSVLDGSEVKAIDIADLLDVSPAYITKFKNGTAIPDPDQFQKMKEFLLERVDPLAVGKLINEYVVAKLGHGVVRNFTDNGTKTQQEPGKLQKGNARFLTRDECKDELELPVIGQAAAASVNTSIYPIAEYADQFADSRQAFRLGRPGDFVIEVSGDSMLPWYPEGTRLLCRASQHLTNGKRVIAVLRDGEVVFKIFAEKGNKFFLFSINGNGHDYGFEKNDYNAVRAVYVVIESAREEDALDVAMRNAGMHHRWEEKLAKEPGDE